MNYFELKIEASSDHHEVLVAQLSDWPFESFLESEYDLKAYLPQNEHTNSLQEDVAELLVNYKHQWNWIEAQNWNAVWESNFEPITVRDEVYVYADFHPKQPSYKHQLLIVPKMSFGTGHHQTTHLMMEYLLDEVVDGYNVLDMGCGTGILGMLALQRGANHLVAIDNDEWAYENTIENLDRNNLRADVLLGGKEAIPNSTFDLILANINKLILMDQMENYAKVLRPGGVLFLSGFYDFDVDDLRNHAASFGLEYRTHHQKDKWVSMKLKMKQL